MNEDQYVFSSLIKDVLMFDHFVLANACYGQPCHNGGSCSMDSNAKGYSCHCQSGFDPATDCLTRHKKSRSLISTRAAIYERFLPNAYENSICCYIKNDGQIKL